MIEAKQSFDASNCYMEAAVRRVITLLQLF
jgi:hypothetical protein